MRTIAVFAAALVAVPLAHAQGGSGEPSPVGQTISPQAASSAERSVQARHDKAVEKRKAKAAKQATNAASAGGQ